jgi:hypothetical protein
MARSAVSTFQCIHRELDTRQVVAELDAAADLWDLYTERRTTPGSPHHEMQDVWVRTRAREDLTTPDAFRLPYAPVFYPAWHRLPAIQPIVWALMARCRAVQLGNILITRIPPGARVHPHIDRGWSVDWFATKFYCVIAGNDGCVNTCLDETVVMPTGSIFTFENRLQHSVENRGDSARISLIVTLRVEA